MTLSHQGVGLGERFYARTPLSMDPLKGPDDQYRAGAQDMLVCAIELLREQTTVTGPHHAADILEITLGGHA